MIDVRGKNVFLCGPMTGLYAYNVARFAWAHKSLLDAGAERVFDPAYEWYASLDAGHERDDHDSCMRRTISELATGNGEGNAFYDMVITIDGWKDSEGASTEVRVARACGIPVYEMQEALGR